MSWTRRMLTAALMVGLAAPAAAQQGWRTGPGGGAMQGPREGHGIGHLLELRRALELTADQASRLESLQADLQEQRNARRTSMMELRAEVRSGELSRNEIRERMQAQRESAQQIREVHRATVREILTEEQRGKLDEIRALHRRGVREGEGARAGFRDPRGMQGPRGFRGQRRAGGR